MNCNSNILTLNSKCWKINVQKVKYHNKHKYRVSIFEFELIQFTLNMYSSKERPTSFTNTVEYIIVIKLFILSELLI